MRRGLLAGLVLLVGSAAGVGRAADLVPEAVSVSPSAAMPGETAQVDFTTSNSDNTTIAGASLTGVFFSADTSCATTGDNTFLDQSSVPVLTAGESFSDSLQVTIPVTASVGEAALCVVVDHTDDIRERGEDNNTATVAFTVEEPRPDLVPTAFASDPTSGSPGDAVRLDFTVENAGVLPAASFSIGFYFSEDDVFSGGSGDTLLGDYLVPSLAAGASITNSRWVSIPSGAVMGVATLFVFADRTSAVLESDSDNNILSTPFTVEPESVDFVVTSVGCSPGAVAHDELFRVFYSIANQGSDSAGLSYVGYWLSVDGDCGTTSNNTGLPGSNVVGSIDPGETIEDKQWIGIHSDWVDTIDAGTYFLCVEADARDDFAELDESNNAAGTWLIVGDPIFADGFETEDAGLWSATVGW